MLDWLESPELRRRCHAGLNKSEQRHFLAQVICTFKQGRIADRSGEAQQFRASGLNLVIAAIGGDVWASHASGTDCSVARRWAMASAM
jgi:TnpA family transposase